MFLRQTTDTDRLGRWSAGRSCSGSFSGFFSFVTLTKLPAEPRLLDHFSSATSRVVRLFRHWGYQSGSERVSSHHLHRRTSGSSQPCTTAVPLVPASNHGVRGTCRKPVLGLAPRRLLTLTRAHSCSRLLGRAEHVFRQTAQAPTFRQWVPALGLIHPHITLGARTPLGVQSLQLSTWTATANRPGMLPVPDMCDHVKRQLPVHTSPQRPSPRSWTDDARGSHHSVQLLHIMQPGQRRRPSYAIAISIHRKAARGT